MDSKAYYLELRAKIFKALGHPSRLKMVEGLFDGERCVCELQAMVGSDISTVSKHLRVLKEAGIVQDERRGTNIYYSLQMRCVANLLGCVEGFVVKRLEEQIAMLSESKGVFFEVGEFFLGKIFAYLAIYAKGSPGGVRYQGPRWTHNSDRSIHADTTYKDDGTKSREQALKTFREKSCACNGGSDKGAPVSAGKAAASSNAMTTAGYILPGVPALVAWWFIYKSLEPFAGWLAHHFAQVLSMHFPALGNTGHLGSALEFLFYDKPKVLMLLVLVVFGIGMIRSYFTPERTRKILAGKREWVGNVLAALHLFSKGRAQGTVSNNPWLSFERDSGFAAKALLPFQWKVSGIIELRQIVRVKKQSRNRQRQLVGAPALA